MPEKAGPCSGSPTKANLHIASQKDRIELRSNTVIKDSIKKLVDGLAEELVKNDVDTWVTCNIIFDDLIIAQLAKKKEAESIAEAVKKQKLLAEQDTMKQLMANQGLVYNEDPNQNMKYMMEMMQRMMMQQTQAQTQAQAEAEEDEEGETKKEKKGRKSKNWLDVENDPSHISIYREPSFYY